MRRVGKGADHNADPIRRSFAAPCPRVPREGAPGRERVGTARVQTTEFVVRSRDCAVSRGPAILPCLRTRTTATSDMVKSSTLIGRGRRNCTEECLYLRSFGGARNAVISIDVAFR